MLMAVGEHARSAVDRARDEGLCRTGIVRVDADGFDVGGLRGERAAVSISAADMEPRRGVDGHGALHHGHDRVRQARADARQRRGIAAGNSIEYCDRCVTLERACAAERLVEEHTDGIQIARR